MISPYFCAGVFLTGRRCQIFSHYIISYFVCQVKRFFNFFSVNFSLHRQVCACHALVPNFYFCQILMNQLRSAAIQLHQLSNFESAAISLYLYFPFYYNTNFKINQAAKAVKFSRANLKRFKF